MKHRSALIWLILIILFALAAVYSRPRFAKIMPAESYVVAEMRQVCVMLRAYKDQNAVMPDSLEELMKWAMHQTGGKIADRPVVKVGAKECEILYFGQRRSMQDPQYILASPMPMVKVDGRNSFATDGVVRQRLFRLVIDKNGLIKEIPEAEFELEVSKYTRKP